MTRLDAAPDVTQLQLLNARRWRPWREAPWFLGLAAGLGLWLWFAGGVAMPLLEAVHTFQVRTQEAGTPDLARPPCGRLAAESATCPCPCPVQPSRRG